MNEHLYLQFRISLNKYRLHNEIETYWGNAATGYG